MKALKYIIASLVAVSAVTLSAQTPHSGYFMDMPGRHQLNPAFANE